MAATSRSSARRSRRRAARARASSAKRSARAFNGGRRAGGLRRSERRRVERLDAATTRVGGDEGAVRGAVRPARGRAIARRSASARPHLGRPIWAMKVTKNAKTTHRQHAPAVLYNAQQHAREWLAGETCRRTLAVLRRQLRQGPTRRRDRHAARRHARAVVLVHLQPGRLRVHVHPGNRLWRKNMADNDGDGVRGEVERRRRPEPQLLHQLGPGQRGLLGRPD